MCEVKASGELCEHAGEGDMDKYGQSKQEHVAQHVHMPIMFSVLLRNGLQSTSFFLYFRDNNFL